MPTLIPIGLLLGVAMLWVFGRWSNQKAIKAAKRRVEACLYEMRLFTDEPSLVWKAQAGLLAANARYIGLMLVPGSFWRFRWCCCLRISRLGTAWPLYRPAARRW